MITANVLVCIHNHILHSIKCLNQVSTAFKYLVENLKQITSSTKMFPLLTITLKLKLALRLITVHHLYPLPLSTLN